MKAVLESESSSPLYYQLMERIRLDIGRGVYPIGTRIPPEHELERKYGLSRVTVRRALQELTDEGLLERKQGKGTFVSAPKARQDLRDIHSFHDACRYSGKIPHTNVIRIREVKAEQRDLSDLELAEGSRVVETVRLRYADQEIVMLEINHFSMAYSYLEDADLNGSLYQLLQEYGIKADKAIHDISLAFVSGEEAKMMEIPDGTPVICLREVIYDQKGRPLHNSYQLIRGEKFTLRI